MSPKRLSLVLVLTFAFAVVIGYLAVDRLDARRWVSDDWALDVDWAMNAVGLRPGMVVGEAGAGDGYFTLPAARRVGQAGVVYANDIDARALSRLRARADREGLRNIHTVAGNQDDPRFPRRDLDIVVIVHAFHDFANPVAWLVNLKQYLRPGATVAVIDVDPARSGTSHFLSRDRVSAYAREAGYEPVTHADDGDTHMVLVFKPSGRQG